MEEASISRPASSGAVVTSTPILGCVCLAPPIVHSASIALIAGVSVPSLSAVNVALPPVIVIL